MQETSNTRPEADTDTVADGARRRLAAAMFGATPQTIGRYHVQTRIGSGGMAVVYAAHDPQLDRRVALKVVSRRASGNQRQRLFREARALAKLQHPNVVQVFEVLEHGDGVAIAMELVEGRDLEAFFAADPPWREVVAVLLQAGRGLDAAHRRGLIHRDFKPHNVLLDGEGRARVADFGLVREEDNPEAEADALEAVGSTNQLTRTGAILGTPAYMAPEIYGGAAADEASDQYALSVALYRGLYGRLPYRAATVAELATRVCAAELPDPPKATVVPSAVHAVVERGMQKDPTDRFSSVAEWVSALERAVRPRRRLAPAIAFVVGVGVAFAVALRGQEAPPCAAAADPVADVFESTQRDRIQAAFLATKASYAEDAWTRFDPQMQRYAEALREQRIAACRATAIDESQSEEMLDQRIACVDRRASETRALLVRLEKAAPEAVAAAPRAVGQLRAVLDCADTERLGRAVEPPAPELVDDVERMRGRLDALRTAYLLGATEVESGRELVAAADATGYAPLQAEVLVEFGFHLRRADKRDEEDEVFQRAFWLATDVGHDDVAVDAAIALTTRAAAEDAEFDAALSWSRTAEAFARRRGAGPQRLARLFVARAVALRFMADYAGAEEAVARALELADEGDTPPAQRAAYVREHAAIAFARGDYPLAAERAEAAAEVLAETHGPNHPETAKGYQSLGITYLRTGRNTEAEQAPRDRHPDLPRRLWIRARRLARRGDGPRHDPRVCRRQRTCRERARCPRCPDRARKGGEQPRARDGAAELRDGGGQGRPRRGRRRDRAARGGHPPRGAGTGARGVRRRAQQPRSVDGGERGDPRGAGPHAGGAGDPREGLRPRTSDLGEGLAGDRCRPARLG